MNWQEHKNKHVLTTTEGFLADLWPHDGGHAPLQPGTKLYLVCRMHKRYYYAMQPDPEDTSDMSDWFSLTDLQLRDKCRPEGPLKENNHAV